MIAQLCHYLPQVGPKWAQPHNHSEANTQSQPLNTKTAMLFPGLKKPLNLELLHTKTFN